LTEQQKPFRLDNVTVEDVDWPANTVTEEGLASTAKSATFTATTVECDNCRLLAITTTEKVRARLEFTHNPTVSC
jgi:hypothetical protein